MEKDKFYKGQKVVITGNTNGHFHDIGEVVTLTRANILSIKNDYWDLKSELWEFDSDDCEPYLEN